MKSRTALFSASILVALFLAGCASMDTSSDSGVVVEKVDMSRENRLPPDDIMRGAKVRSFRTMDKDGDGVITWEEWQQEDNSQYARNRFDALDENKDEKIGYDEFIKSANAYVVSEDVYIPLDRQRDGMLQRGEQNKVEGVKAFKIEF